MTSETPFLKPSLELVETYRADLERLRETRDQTLLVGIDRILRAFYFSSAFFDSREMEKRVLEACNTVAPHIDRNTLPSEAELASLERLSDAVRDMYERVRREWSSDLDAAV